MYILYKFWGFIWKVFDSDFFWFTCISKWFWGWVNFKFWVMKPFIKKKSVSIWRMVKDIKFHVSCTILHMVNFSSVFSFQNSKIKFYVNILREKYCSTFSFYSSKVNIFSIFDVIIEVLFFFLFFFL